MKPDEFYVGYMPKAPMGIASAIRKVIFFIGFLIVSALIVLVWYQKKFSTSNFEYGINTTIEGYIFTEPVPYLAVPLGVTEDGTRIFQNILLVGFGKAGAKEVIEHLQQKAGKPFIGSEIKLSGFLIYGDGKAIMQITPEDNDNIVRDGAPILSNLSWSSMGKVSMDGEVVDPKCYFGVMKPGEGKAHRACAVRCIAGGIPPVFHTAASKDYFLLLNEDLEPINQEILPIVGDQITLSGDLIFWNDWKILKIKTKTLQELAKNKKKRDQLLALSKGMTVCKNE